MLRAGLEKLKILEEEFTKENPNKHPKMLVMCEDTSVSPLVIDFLKNEGLTDDEIMQIDSDRKGSVKESEWKEIKQRLFNLDKHAKPKVVVSVLMLREGFDVSNVCVIVPLRSSQAPILLEQVIGRGLRLMWREPDYQEIKAENRYKMFNLKQEPSNYLDILSIIEHPAYIQFYEDLEQGLVVDEKKMPPKESILGDIITVGLKENYQDYDIYIPKIVQEQEEILEPASLSIDEFEKFQWTYEQLKSMVPDNNDENFYSQEMTVQTRFGNYKVSGNIFNAQSYNDFLSKILNAVSNNIAKIGVRATKEFPVMQINQVQLISVIDNYIKNKLFGQPFNPMVDNNWRILMISKVGIVQHIMKEVSQTIYEMQNNIRVEDAIIKKRIFFTSFQLKNERKFRIGYKKISLRKDSLSVK